MSKTIVIFSRLYSHRTSNSKGGRDFLKLSFIFLSLLSTTLLLWCAETLPKIGRK